LGRRGGRGGKSYLGIGCRVVGGGHLLGGSGLKVEGGLGGHM